MKVKYFSDDGKEFFTEDACKKYEASNTLPNRLMSALAGGGPKAVALIEAALRYDMLNEAGLQLAEDLETAGRKCSDARVANGGAKRKRKPKDKPNGAPTVGEGVREEPVDGNWPMVVSVERIGPDTLVSSWPTSDNSFPAHGAAGKVPSKGFDGPTAAE